MSHRVSLWLLIGVVAGACAPPRQSAAPEISLTSVTVGQQDFDGSREIDLRHRPGVMETTLPASLSAVWTILPEVFDALDIDVTRIDASTGVMGNPGYRARRIEGERMSLWLDCGRGLVRPYADAYEVRLTVIVQLLPSPDGGTTVRTTVDAYARDRSVNGSAVHCLSWGTLERRIAQLATLALDS